MKKPIILIDNFIGGMTLNSKMGRKDQFFLGDRLDFDGHQGKLTNGYSWRDVTLSAGTANNEFSVIVDTYNKTIVNQLEIYFGNIDKKIYVTEPSSDSSILYKLRHTIANSASVTGVMDMDEYNNFLLYSYSRDNVACIGKKDLTLHRSAGYTDIVFSASASINSFMPIKIGPDKIVYVGFGRYISTIQTESLTFSPNSFDLLGKNCEIRCLENFGYSYMAVGANYPVMHASGLGTNNSCRLLLWNRLDAQANDEIFIPENEIKALKYVAGYLWIWAGRTCNIYVVPEGSRQATLMHKFITEDPTDRLEVYPNAVDVRNGKIFFALSDVNQNSSDKNPCGVYNFPINPNEFKLNLPFMANGYLETMRCLTNVKYATNRESIHFGYYAGSGVKKIKRERSLGDGATESPYIDNATFYSLYYYAPQNKKISTERFGIDMDPQPAGTLVSLYYRKNNETAWTTVFVDFYTANETEAFKNIQDQADRIQLKLVISGAQTDNPIHFERPIINSIYITGDVIDKP